MVLTQLLTRSAGIISSGPLARCGEGGKLVAYGFYNTTMGKGGSIPLDFMQLQLWNLWPNGRSTAFYSIGPLRKKHADWFSEDLTRVIRFASTEQDQARHCGAYAIG